MKKTIPFLILAAIVVVFFRQFFLQNLLPIPADTIVGLYNPYRDLYAKNYPRGIPFKNFLITDPVRQQYPWRLESVLQEKMGQLPLWNPYQFAGSPLLANQQSAAFFPFNLLLFVLPFPFAWSVLIFLQPVLGGFFMFLYLRNLKLRTLPSLLGCVAFVFSGFFIAWLEWGTVDNVLLWLPFLLLCIDKIYAGRKKTLWYPLYFLALSISFFAGHLQTFFYILLLVHGYLFLQWMQSKEKIKNLLWGISFAAVALFLTSIQWIPLFQLILLSARDTDLVMTAGWYLPWQHLVTFFVPDFFGNPTTLNYWGVWNYAELTGYIGIPALFFAVFALFGRYTKKLLFFVGILILSLLFALPTPLAKLPFTFHIPFLATAQPTRLLSLVDFSLSILAAFGLSEFLQNRKKMYFPLGIFLAVFVLLWVVVLFHVRLFPAVSAANIAIAKHNLFFPTGIFVGLTILILPTIFLKRKVVLLAVAILLVGLAAFDGIRFADKFTPFTKSQYLFPSTKTIEFLQSHIGNNRIMTTDSQILPPNFSTMYHIQSIDGYDPLYLKTYGELIAAMERNKPDIHEPFGFNRIITPHNFNSRLVDLLGVKYVLSLNELSSSKLKQVFTEGQTKVYENLQVYPRAFFVKEVGSVSPEDLMNVLFDPTVNIRNDAIVLLADRPYRNLGIGSVDIRYYSSNSVIIHTQNKLNGFLVLTDAYYPTWHAYVDGKETRIYQTDLVFRGISVPAGNHLVEFKDQLF